MSMVLPSAETDLSVISDVKPTITYTFNDNRNLLLTSLILQKRICFCSSSSSASRSGSIYMVSSICCNMVLAASGKQKCWTFCDNTSLNNSWTIKTVSSNVWSCHHDYNGTAQQKYNRAVLHSKLKPPSHLRQLNSVPDDGIMCKGISEIQPSQN